MVVSLAQPPSSRRTWESVNDLEHISLKLTDWLRDLVLTISCLASCHGRSLVGKLDLGSGADDPDSLGPRCCCLSFLDEAWGYVVDVSALSQSLL